MYKDSSHQHSHFGFTLIEALITMSLAALLLGMAVPSFNELIQKNRIATETNRFIASLHFARSEAIKRGTQVVVCRASSNNCSTSMNWESGWLLFVDADQDGIKDNGEVVLQSYSKLPNQYTLRGGSNYSNWLAYLPSGISLGSGGAPNDVFRLCDQSANTATGRTVNINTVGRISLSIGTTSCP